MIEHAVGIYIGLLLLSCVIPIALLLQLPNEGVLEIWRPVLLVEKFVAKRDKAVQVLKEKAQQPKHEANKCENSVKA